ncbi:hypothetical protein AALP_AA6G237500 [Arabis alpina]|uniref:Uncharacterized protein n=1 Tax=Arabis alpina TaxID=50452 RepID=A0A087GRA4_ARAAL|nr:hypothetical protein AALP_AA6G237500 [Arabis alpina]
MSEVGDFRVSGEHEAMITDCNEKGWPPLDPPDDRVSWAKKVSGMSAVGRLTSEMVLAEGFVAEKLSVEFPNGVDGEPEITIGDEVLAVHNCEGLGKEHSGGSIEHEAEGAM